MELALEVTRAVKVFYERPEQTNGKTGWKLIQSLLGLEREPVRAVNDISFSVSKREIFGILGPNGSGKSTLVRLIATLLLPDSGNITVFGHDVVTERLAVRRLINRVSVDAAFFKKLSARENLMYAGRLYGLGGKEITIRITKTLELLGFPTRKLDVSLSELSRGQQQKVAVARALLTSPVLVLLDEPTTGLDPKSRREVQDFILAIRDEHNATVLLTSHDMTEVARLSDRISVLDRGQIVAIDTPEALIHRYGPLGAELRGNTGSPDLEDVFFALTGRSVDEEEE